MRVVDPTALQASVAQAYLAVKPWANSAMRLFMPSFKHRITGTKRDAPTHPTDRSPGAKPWAK